MGTPAEQQRPSIAVVEREYRSMLEEAQSVLTESYGAGTWLQYGDEEVGGFGCDDVEGGEGLTLNLGTGGAIADEEWPAALAAVEDVVGEHGFTELEVIIDRPGDHLVRLAKADGGYVDFGTKAATILRVRSGCHPTGTGMATGD